MGLQAEFKEHLESGVTTLCHAWAITRRDGVEFGFTDHDLPLVFDGKTFRADTGLSAMALQQSTGLSIDNTEAMGALSDSALREEDIEAGRFDDAEVMAWLVNWVDVSQRMLQFRGTIGELKRTAGGFRAELRGLTEALNRPLGRVYQKPCTAVLGDSNCKFDLSNSAYFTDRAVEIVEDGRVFRWSVFAGFVPAWFTRGRLAVLSGAGAGLDGIIKKDVVENGMRAVELWEPIRANITTGDQVRLEAGCDKRFQSCQLKFNNVVNYQGFPDIPGEDWMAVPPKSSGSNTGGSLR